MTGSNHAELELTWTVKVEYKAVLAHLEKLLKRSLRPEEVVKAMSLIETPDTRFLEQLADMQAVLRDATTERVLRRLEA